MRDYPNILVAFLDKFDEGYQFERWPHHITVLSWFKADRIALESLENIVKEALPIKVYLGQTAMFGARNDILVRLVESEQLDKLHNSLLVELEGLLGLVSYGYSGSGYSPHVTLQGKNDPEPGHLQIERISLVKKVEPGKTKKVIGNYESATAS